MSLNKKDLEALDALRDGKEFFTELVKLAREMCGCVQCVGGFAIGARTLAAPSEQRPTSCLAPQLLDMFSPPEDD